MRKEAAEPNAPGMNTGAIRSAPSRRALSLASAPCSESLARVTSRRPDFTTTSRAPVHHHSSRCLSGGSYEGAPPAPALGGVAGGRALDGGRGSVGLNPGSAVKVGGGGLPSVGLNAPVCVMEGGKGGVGDF